MMDDVIDRLTVAHATTREDAEAVLAQLRPPIGPEVLEAAGMLADCGLRGSYAGAMLRELIEAADGRSPMQFAEVHAGDEPKVLLDTYGLRAGSALLALIDSTASG